MSRPYVVIDFETASKVDLKKAGSWRYSEDDSTVVLCLAYLPAGETEPYCWTPEDYFAAEHLRALVEDPEVWFIAHNAAFEKAIWRNIMMPRYGFPDIPNERWHDTMAVCAMKRLPLEMGHAAKALGLHEAKDAEGRALVLKISARYRKTGVFVCDEATLDRVCSYCIQDVRAEMALHLAIGGLPPGERQVWLLDQAINERGVALDQDFVASSQTVLDLALPALKAEFKSIVGCNHGQRQKVLDWLRWEENVDIKDMTKKTVDELIGKDEEEDDDVDQEDNGREGGDNLPALSGGARRALALRKLVRSTSVTKLQRMAGCVGSDGRARGLLQYHGAGTGRWAGRLFQPQNFPRGSLKTRPDLVVDAIHAAARIKDPSFVELALEVPPVEAVASALRHTIVAKPGRSLAAGDFAQIEARVVLALAGQRDKVELFASGAPIYADMAQAIYGRPITKEADLEEYTIGKNTVLGCGFGMGAKKFHQRYCPKQPFSFAYGVIQKYRGDPDEAIEGWAPNVKGLWLEYQNRGSRLLDGAIDDLDANGVRFALKGDWMTILLPSGRQLYYRGLHRRPPSLMTKITSQGLEVPVLDDNGQPRTHNHNWGYYGPFSEIKLYGGIVTENIVQAIARDIMVHAMRKCEAEGLHIVLTVHDEIVCETPRQDAAVVLKQIMEDGPTWAKNIGIPVAAETWQGDRYRK